MLLHSTIGVSLRLGQRLLWMAPGDVLGRHHRCAVPVRDRRVSEAHAMLALRGGDLRMLNLRGGLRVAGTPMQDVRLVVGTQLEVAPGLFLEVVDVCLPDQVLALIGPGIDVVLQRACSLVTAPKPTIAPGHVPGAAAHFWHDGLSWTAETENGPLPLVPGQQVTLGSWVGRAELRSRHDASTNSTQRTSQNLELYTCFDTVQLFQNGVLKASFAGIKARLLHELAEVAGPIAWQVVAEELWRETSASDLRRRWDKTLSRLRVTLREAGLRDDLVRATGTGQVELLLYPGDQVQCRD